MKIVRSIPELKLERRKITGSVGFVPNMGYLHEGHLSLVRRAKAETDCTAVSIFVNPTQFLPHEDFETYPRDEERDLELLKKEEVDLIFIPGVKEMYPDGHCTFIDVECLEKILEGAFRPGHFRGVATVCAKLFNLVEPTKSYFGQKDSQQVLVIKKMVADLDMNLEVIACPTIRDEDGLAMSSRNVYLNPEQRRTARVLSHALFEARELWASGERNANVLRSRMTARTQAVLGAKIEYISVADPETLTELERVNSAALASLAVKFGHIRLIDNVLFD
jgi:pantoate--beta-alanine ligase